MENFKASIKFITSLSDDDWAYFLEKMEFKTFQKSEALIDAGKTEHYLSFIEKGVVRYWIGKEDREITINFGFENSFVSSYTSFLTRTPSALSIQALTNVAVWRISYATLQEIYKQTDLGEHLGRKAAEALFMDKASRELDLLTESAAQRYQNLFTKQPKLIREIPQKYLASYIGITPQALSRIRKRLAPIS